ASSQAQIPRPGLCIPGRTDERGPRVEAASRRLGVARPAARPETDPVLDGDAVVETGPRPEGRRPAFGLPPGHEPDELDRHDLGLLAVPELANGIACGLDAGAFQVDEVHRD